MSGTANMTDTIGITGMRGMRTVQRAACVVRHVGVGGLSMAAARRTEPNASAGRALDGLHEWLPGLPGWGDPADPADPAGLVGAIRVDRFPFAAVLAHYREAGRAEASGELVGRLRRLDDLLAEHAPPGTRRLWPLPQWLPGAVDQHAGSFDSYLVTGLLDGGTDGDPDRSTDVLLAALAADLALVEANALQWGRPSRQQRQRTQACLLLLSRIADLAPRWAQRPALTVPQRLAAGDPGNHTWLAEVTKRLALQVHRQLPEQCRLAVDLSMLPMTRLHDEQLFIRGAQIFQTVYRQVHRCLVRAAAAMARLEVERVRAELADATHRLSLHSALQGLVATMPPDSFELFRGYPCGLVAVQAHRDRRLADAVSAITYRIGRADAGRLAPHLRALDDGWRAMKRAHQPLLRP